MSGVLLGRWAPHSDEWYAAREGRIGGSEIASVVGIAPPTWGSRYSLWCRKTGLIDSKRETSEMRWGTLIERLVRDEFLRTHPDLRLLRGTIRNAGTWIHPEHDFALYNPDGIGREHGDLVLYEGKTTDSSNAWEWGPKGSDLIPPYYQLQVRWGMWITGATRTHVAVLIGGNDLRTYVVEPDDSDTEWMVAEAASFIDSVATGTPPDIDSSSATYEALRESVPDVDRDTQVILPTELADSYHRAVAALAQAKTDEQLHRSLVMDAMGTAHKAQTDDGRHIATRSRRKLPSGDYSKTSLTPARNYTPTTTTTTDIPF